MDSILNGIFARCVEDFGWTWERPPEWMTVDSRTGDGTRDFLLTDPRYPNERYLVEVKPRFDVGTSCWLRDVCYPTILTRNPNAAVRCFMTWNKSFKENHKPGGAMEYSRYGNPRPNNIFFRPIWDLFPKHQYFPFERI